LDIAFVNNAATFLTYAFGFIVIYRFKVTTYMWWNER